MGNPTSTQLYQLRDHLTKELLSIMVEGEPCLDKEGYVIMVAGKPLMKRPAASTLTVIRQYLKDNGVDHDEIEVPSGPPPLDSLPFREEASEQLIDVQAEPLGLEEF